MAPKFLDKKFFFACPPKPWRRMGFLFLVIIIILGMGGFFLWKILNYRLEPVYTTMFDREYVNADDFKTENTPDGKLLKNDDSGFSLKIPDKWFLKGYVEEISILSPEIELEADGNVDPESFKSKGACGFSIQITRTKKVNPDFLTDDEYLKKEISILKNDNNKLEEGNFKEEVVSVGGKEGVKQNTFRNNQLYLLQVRVPRDGIVYVFSSGIIFNQKCVDSFNDILGTVLINK